MMIIINRVVAGDEEDQKYSVNEAKILLHMDRQNTFRVIKKKFQVNYSIILITAWDFFVIRFFEETSKKFRWFTFVFGTVFNNSVAKMTGTLVFGLKLQYLENSLIN